jgi:hypothetical protein
LPEESTPTLGRWFKRFHFGKAQVGEMRFCSVLMKLLGNLMEAIGDASTQPYNAHGDPSEYQ